MMSVEGHVGVETEEERRERLVLEAMPMVWRCAKKIHPKTHDLVELGDLVGVGKVELAEHERRLDPKKGDSLAAYASAGVFFAMMEYVADQRGLKGARRDLFLLLSGGAARSFSALEMEGQSAEEGHDVLVAGIWMGGAGAKDPESAAIAAELRARLAAARRELPPGLRQIVELHWDGEVPLEKVGAKLGMSRTTVKARHRRALKSLGARLRGRKKV